MPPEATQECGCFGFFCGDGQGVGKSSNSSCARLSNQHREHPTGTRKAARCRFYFCVGRLILSIVGRPGMGEVQIPGATAPSIEVSPGATRGRPSESVDLRIVQLRIPSFHSPLWVQSPSLSLSSSSSLSLSLSSSRFLGGRTTVMLHSSALTLSQASVAITDQEMTVPTRPDL